MGFIDILRQYRIGPFTIFDTAAAYIGIFLVAPILTRLFSKIHLSISRTAWLWLTLPISVVVHFILHQNTPFMKMLLDPNDSYIAKIILIFMLFMGIRQIKIQKSIHSK